LNFQKDWLPEFNLGYSAVSIKRPEEEWKCVTCWSV